MSRTSEYRYELQIASGEPPAERSWPQCTIIMFILLCACVNHVGVVAHSQLIVSEQRSSLRRIAGTIQPLDWRLADWSTEACLDSAEITKAQLLALRLTLDLMEAGSSRPAQISMAKRNNVWMALECARRARDILGAAGITDQHSAIRHAYESGERVHVRRHARHSHLDHRVAILLGLDAFGG